MHYSTKQFGLFTLSCILLLHLYLFKDEIRLSFIQWYHQLISLLLLLQLHNDSIIIIGFIYGILIISGLYITYKLCNWILCNLIYHVYNSHNEHVKVE
ncbi:unnamed protein product [Schistosoma bovis]|nr:unnamed protein product [Schistosoma bovis]